MAAKSSSYWPSRQELLRRGRRIENGRSNEGISTFLDGWGYVFYARWVPVAPRTSYEPKAKPNARPNKNDGADAKRPGQAGAGNPSDGETDERRGPVTSRPGLPGLIFAPSSAASSATDDLATGMTRRTAI